MSERNHAEMAKTVYDLLCRTLDKNEWKYEKDEENLSVDCSARGDDLPINLNLQVEEERGLLLLYSLLPFEVAQDKRLEVALAVCAVNNLLADGNFDYDITSGRLLFRMSNSFRGNRIGGGAVEYLLYGSCQIIDEFNDKFLMVAKGYVSFEQFFKALNDAR